MSYNAKWIIALSIVVIGISFTCIILMATWGYNMQVNTRANLPERLPPAVPPERATPPWLLIATPDS